jgi:gamma-glutamylcyclotransferase (GGCT)/AIG2-like uncharacterized protein YtfP
MLSLFVDGTLGPNRPNAHILENIGGTWATAFVHGELHAKGWAADLGFLGIVLSEDAPTVQGFIFFSDNLAQHWTVLDAFEGEGYVRSPVQATLVETGERINSWVYSLK